MDKSWLKENRWSKKYADGVDKLLDFAFNSSANIGGQIPCLCKNCRDQAYLYREEVRTHMIVTGMPNYLNHFRFQGEGPITGNTSRSKNLPPIIPPPSLPETHNMSKNLPLIIPPPFSPETHNMTMERYEIANENEAKLVLDTIGKLWNCHKTRLRRAIYKAISKGVPLEEVIKVVPFNVPFAEWVQFVKKWTSPEHMNISQEHKIIRAKQTVSHTTGSKSYAQVHADLKKEKKRDVGVVELFYVCHQRKDGGMMEEAMDIWERSRSLYNEREAAQEVTSPSARLLLEKEALRDVQAPEHPSRVRGAGRGPTPSMWYGKLHRKDGTSQKMERMESTIADLKAELAQRDAQWETQMAQRDAQMAQRDAQIAEMSKVLEKLNRRNERKKKRIN